MEYRNTDLRLGLDPYWSGVWSHDTPSAPMIVTESVKLSGDWCDSDFAVSGSLLAYVLRVLDPFFKDSVPRRRLQYTRTVECRGVIRAGWKSPTGMGFPGE